MTEFETKIKTLLDNADADGDVINDFFQEAVTVNSVQNAWIADAAIEFVKELKNIGINFYVIDSYGGEGKGDEYWSVYQFSDKENITYVKFDGYYQSYCGATFNEWYFVEPKEVTVVKYLKK